MPDVAELHFDAQGVSLSFGATTVAGSTASWGEGVSSMPPGATLKTARLISTDGRERTVQLLASITPQIVEVQTPATPAVAGVVATSPGPGVLNATWAAPAGLRRGYAVSAVALTEGLTEPQSIFVTGTSAGFADLEPGEWRITVEADANGIPVASATVTLEPPPPVGLIVISTPGGEFVTLTPA